MSNLPWINLLVTKPGQFFQELDAAPRFWFALLLSMALSLVVMFWYYSGLNIAWFVDYTFSANPKTAQIPEEQRAKALAFMTRNFLLFTSLFAAIVAIAAQRLLEALYLLVAGKVTGVKRSYRHWLALSCWSSLPVAFAALTGAVMLLLQDSRQMAPDVLSPLSLNSLFFNLHLGQPGYSLVTSLSLLHLPSWALAIIGVRTWSGRSMLFSTVLVLLPVVLVYGIWAGLAWGTS